MRDRYFTFLYFFYISFFFTVFIFHFSFLFYISFFIFKWYFYLFARKYWRNIESNLLILSRGFQASSGSGIRLVVDKELIVTAWWRSRRFIIRSPVTFGLMSRIRLPGRAIINDRQSKRSGNVEKEKFDSKHTDGLSHAPPPRKSSKRLVSRFKCPGIHWVGQIQRLWPLPRPVRLYTLPRIGGG